jgi:hypothetical protein
VAKIKKRGGLPHFLLAACAAVNDYLYVDISKLLSSSEKIIAFLV